MKSKGIWSFISRRQGIVLGFIWGNRIGISLLLKGTFTKHGTREKKLMFAFLWKMSFFVCVYGGMCACYRMKNDNTWKDKLVELGLRSSKLYNFQNCNELPFLATIKQTNKCCSVWVKKLIILRIFRKTFPQFLTYFGKTRQFQCSVWYYDSPHIVPLFSSLSLFIPYSSPV